jgi:hypothetical protein
MTILNTIALVIGWITIALMIAPLIFGALLALAWMIHIVDSLIFKLNRKLRNKP